jgi:hypothetical protein
MITQACNQVFFAIVIVKNDRPKDRTNSKQLSGKNLFMQLEQG